MWKRVIIILLVVIKVEVARTQERIIFNEVMYDAPSFAGDTNGEWVELYNTTDNTINISNWVFNDGASDKIIPPGTTITPYGYIVLIERVGTFTAYNYPGTINTVEIGNFSLNDSTDTLTLKNASLNIIDKLEYDKKWGVGTMNSGRTLEKIYPLGSNTDFYWASSKIPYPYGSPGQQNSVYLDIPAIQRVRLLINEIMFSDSHDWVEVYCVDDGNLGKGTQINGFYFDDLDGNKDKVVGTCTIRTGEFLLLHYGIQGQDDTEGINGKINLFTQSKFITSTTDQMIIYNLLDEIIDAVCWANNTPPSYEEKDWNELITAGAWQGEAIDSTKVSAGQSIARNGDTKTKNDWYVASVPTPGLPNNLTSQAADPPQAKVINIINKTFAPQEGKQTTIIYSLSKSAAVSIRIYDIRGRLVKRLIEQEYQIAKEENMVSWDGRDESGEILPIGVYICYVEAVGDGGSSADKVTLILAKRL
ncbi:MAG: lamin tail domain-containing protein [bacterium]|nr:lamin tail domain-containing protein [bacterium]